MPNLKRTVVVVLLALQLVACGGGGESGSSKSSTEATTIVAPNTPTMTLELNKDNFHSISSMVPATGNMILALGQFGVGLSDRFVVRGEPLSITEACSEQGGTIAFNLVDRDGDGKSSTGDALSAVMNNCASPLLSRIVSGKLEVEIEKITARPIGNLSAKIKLIELSGTEIYAISGFKTTSTLSGSMAVESQVNESNSSLKVASTTNDDLQLSSTANQKQMRDFFRKFSFVKTTDLATLRIEVSMSYLQESGLLDGSFLVSTPSTLTLLIARRFDSGTLRIDGGKASTIRIFHNRNEITPPSGHPSIEPASNGWGTLGFFFWNGLQPLRWAYATYPYSDFDLRDDESVSQYGFGSGVFFDPNTATSADAKFKMLFSRELAPIDPTLFFRFRDDGDRQFSGYTDPEHLPIAASVTQHGALLIFRPLRPLRHNRSYSFQVSRDGVSWYPSGFDAFTEWRPKGISNQSIPLSPTRLFGVLTPATLQAKITRSRGILQEKTDLVQLNGSDSFSTLRPIAKYLWRQISGTSLKIANTHSAITDVSWGDIAPSEVESAVIELVVTDIYGYEETALTTVTLANLNTSTRVLAFSTTNDPGVLGDIRIITGKSDEFFDPNVFGNGQMNLMYVAKAPATGNGSFSIAIVTGDKLPLHIGHYLNAAERPQKENQHAFSFSYNGWGCTVLEANFNVLEIAYNSAGGITQLAMDFEQRCDPLDKPLFGSYRLNSKIPINPNASH